MKGTDSASLMIGIPGEAKVNEAFTFSYDNDGMMQYQPNLKFFTLYYCGGDHGKGTVTLSLKDTVAHKIAGTFTGVVIKDGGGDTLKVTNGQFNTNYMKL